MSFKGFVREIDSVGRVVIPKQLRKDFGLTSADSHVIITAENGCIVMRKAVNACVFCKSEHELSEFSGQFICAACLSDIKNAN